MILGINGIIAGRGTTPSTLLNSLVSAYNAENNTNDALGTNNGTAVGGLTYTTGKIGQAFQFNVTNAYVTLPDNTLNFTGDFSYSFWLYLTSTTGVQPLVNNYKEISASDWRGNLVFVYNSNLYFRIGYGTSIFVDLITPFISTNQWVNIVVTRKSSIRSQIYINGTLTNSNSSTINPTYFPTMNYNMIGSYYDGNGYRYLANGSKIDAFNVWNRVLTVSEISELYNSGVGKQYPF